MGFQKDAQKFSKFYVGVATHGPGVPYGFSKRCPKVFWIWRGGSNAWSKGTIWVLKKVLKSFLLILLRRSHAWLGSTIQVLKKMLNCSEFSTRWVPMRWVRSWIVRFWGSLSQFHQRDGIKPDRFRCARRYSVLLCYICVIKCNIEFVEKN